MTREEIVQGAFLNELAEIEKAGGVMSVISQGAKQLKGLVTKPGAMKAGVKGTFRKGVEAAQAVGPIMPGQGRKAGAAAVAKKFAPGAAVAAGGALGAYGAYRGAKRLIQGPEQRQPPQQPR